MDFTDFQTGKDDEGRRLDKVIRVFISDSSLSNIYQSLRKGLIKINNKKTKADYRIIHGDIINIADFLLTNNNTKKTSFENTLNNVDLDINKIIVFENDHILIINKPSGINVQKAQKNETSLTEIVMDYYEKTHKKQGLSFKPGPLHRLDKMTSGLVCFSMSLDGAKWFSSQMREHKIKKSYRATVEGFVEQIQNWTDYIIKKNSSENEKAFHTVKIISGDEKLLPEDAKKCITTIIPVNSFSVEKFSYTKVFFEIQTGRQHQIRAQSAFHGHPLAGDNIYGAKSNSTLFDLCAYKLEFPENLLNIPHKIELK